MKHAYRVARLFASLALLTTTLARADALHEWNVKAIEIAIAARMPAAQATRTNAIVQTAVYEAVNAITGRYAAGELKLQAPAGASIDAAIAAANRVALSGLMAAQSPAIDAAYQDALVAIPDRPAKTDGIALGEAAATGVLAQRENDGAATTESYRPYTTAGAYVPTVMPAVPQWGRRRPWAMRSADQFRPGPPPDLKSARWAADYNEIKSLGGKASKSRTAEQTEIARFWEATGVAIYFPIVRSVTTMPGREVTRNARLLAIAAQAMDDASIAVYEAKYHYNLWRPITAIRNGDLDGNDATERDAAWQPFIATPMHPEYPCAHCIAAAAIGAVLRAELGSTPPPKLTSTSPTAPGAVRAWTRIEDFVEEVSAARIYDGVHFRFSTEVGTVMGEHVGEQVVEKFRGSAPRVTQLAP
jgi:PAP2 superfamily